jgi:exodeoxyribonuclease VII large subunit
MLGPMATFEQPAPAPTPGIPESTLAGPFPVGEYASALRTRLRAFARVQLVGELVNLRIARARVYFELRDAGGAIACSAWRDDWERMLTRCAREPEEGTQVVVAGGCDYYVGSATSSPGFSFHVGDLRVAGEGDLLARIDRLRKRLDAEGLLDPQKQLRLPQLPRSIGVITGETGKARHDVLAALARRGWSGRLVWAFAPVQDRHAAPAIVRALGDLAAVARVEVVIVARGGGSLADLLCFCDETLCRTVALSQVPVIASVGHHTDRTLLDDVAAASCSTPTHAAEAAVGVDCARARRDQVQAAARLREHGRRAVLQRARLLATLSRAPAAHLDRQHRRLHQQLREIRAASRRRLADERGLAERRALVLTRKAESTLLDCRDRRPRELEQLRRVLDGHDPQRTLERGYALVTDPAGEPVASAGTAARERRLDLRFADGELPVEVRER